ncbi:hypothetical protein BH20ACT6_BH20ACT6_17950 [soil metagenome]
MQLIVNGAQMDADEGTSVAELVDARAEGRRWVAVARNGDVVPRDLWASTVVRDGDSVEILVPTAGG